MVTLIFSDKNGTHRPSGWARYGYSSDLDTEQTVATNEDELSAVFEQSGVDELDGVDEPIEAAVDNPMDFLDFLLFEEEEIVFNDEHVREGDDDTE